MGGAPVGPQLSAVRYQPPVRGATVLSFDEAPIRPVTFDELGSVRLVRDFLAAPQRYLRHVRSDAGT